MSSITTTHPILHQFGLTGTALLIRHQPNHRILPRKTFDPAQHSPACPTQLTTLTKRRRPWDTWPTIKSNSSLHAYIHHLQLSSNKQHLSKQTPHQCLPPPHIIGPVLPQQEPYLTDRSTISPYTTTASSISMPPDDTRHRPSQLLPHNTLPTQRKRTPLKIKHGHHPDWIIQPWLPTCPRTFPPPPQHPLAT